MPAPSTSPITKTVSIGRVIAGRSGDVRRARLASAPVWCAHAAAGVPVVAPPGHDPADPPAGRPPYGWTPRRTRRTRSSGAVARRSTSASSAAGSSGLLRADAAQARGRDGRRRSRPTASRPASPATRPPRSPCCTGWSTTRCAPHFGAERRAHYAEANSAGLELIAGWRAEDAIDCDFRRRPAFTYAEDERPRQLREARSTPPREAGPRRRARRRRRPPVARRRRGPPRRPGRVPPAPLPARDRRRASTATARTCSSARARSASTTASPCRVETEAGGEVTAARRRRRHPLPDARPRPVLRAARARSAPTRSACAPAAPRPARHVPVDRVARRTRCAPRRTTGGELLIVGGESHKTGTGDPSRALRARSRRGRASASTSTAVEYRWSAQDAMPADGDPVRRASSRRSRATSWTATGFSKWGMTNGAAAAMHARRRDRAARENPWAADVRRRTASSRSRRRRAC